MTSIIENEHVPKTTNNLFNNKKIRSTTRFSSKLCLYEHFHNLNMYYVFAAFAVPDTKSSEQQSVYWIRNKEYSNNRVNITCNN